LIFRACSSVDSAKLPVSTEWRMRWRQRGLHRRRVPLYCQLLREERRLR